MTSLDHLMIGLDKFGPDNDVLYTEIVGKFLFLYHSDIARFCLFNLLELYVLLFSSYQLTMIFFSRVSGRDTIENNIY